MFQIVGFLSKCSSGYCLGRFSLRDLLKWCKRITSFRFCFDGSLSEEQCNFIYTKEVDVFAEFPASFDNRLSIMKEPLHERTIPFVAIHSSLLALERIARSVKHNELVLLVGETGTGKTTLVQNLALRLGQKLTVLNMSQQSDVADLLGGFMPVGEQFVYSNLCREFMALFARIFSKKKNKTISLLSKEVLCN
ncbi:hypothetical protein P8452_61194 [Trifolium repens]|nr:hypothetical protein P8452_61194 [Trifolium repens]